MTDKEHKKPPGRIIDVYVDDDDESGSGEAGSKINQVDFMNPGPSRDDLLPVDQKRDLLIKHKGKNETAVEKQKETRDNRANPNKGLQAGLSAKTSEYLPHPELEKMRGVIDDKASPAPEQSETAETNPELRHQLTNEYRLTNKPSPGPAPSPPPRFTR